MINWAKTQFRIASNRKSEVKLLNSFREIQNSSEEKLDRIQGSIYHAFDVLNLHSRLNELWMQHYDHHEGMSYKREYLKIVDGVENLSKEYKIKNMPIEAIGIQLLIYFLFCEISKNRHSHKTRHSKEIFDYYIKEGKINFNPPPKHRHLFLDHLD